ncbi:MAG: LamG domain-containing protein, partial [bacterium]|nr:LamG domain-containing protein [bacterium]
RVDDIELHNTLQSAQTPRGSVGEWNFNEAFGSKTTDISGQDRHGTFTNMSASDPAASVWTMGRLDKALQFATNANSYVSIPDSSVSFANGLTFSAWVKYENLTDTYKAIASGLTGSGTSGVYPRMFQSLGRIHFQAYVGGSMVELVSSSGYISVGQWTHVAAVVDTNARVVTLYINGTARGSVSFSGTAIDTGTSAMYIGNDATLSKAFHGCIDEVKLYNRALTATEIIYLAQ